ncbi:CoA transferase, partial [Brachybacterium sp. HMSC06H03]|uniref:CoA transferase n=1 Tax=Brachybacterium sp. HMSC06H03 TaxID=1581127 RepID=UPI000AB362AA
TVPSATAPRGGGDGAAGGLLDGVRVLDLTRVIAGPTASQLLACLGADVLRIDPSHRPEILAQHLSTGMGKRSAILDLRDAAQRERARTLAAGADVILTGYRPGALARHGLGVEDLADLAPHAVIGALSAWGGSGPWGERAGFDSIVQAATGIAALCGSAERPGALPVQVLDHATGHRLAGAVLEALAAGRARTLRIGLLGAAEALLSLPGPTGREVAALPMPTVRVRSGARELVAVPPPLLVGGRTIERDVPEYGAAAPRWSPRAAGRLGDGRR